VGPVLIIDESRGLAVRLESFLKNCVPVSSVADARRKMLIEKPCGVVFALDDVEGGVLFAKSLRDHPSFSEIPFLILCDDMRLVSDLSIPVAELAATDEVLKNFLIRHLGAEVIQESPAQLEESKPSRVSSATKAPQTPEQLFLQAQRLLAQVLHNLKTSNLLDMIELEDLPETLLEMTKKVCESAKNRGKPPAVDSILKAKGSVLK